MVPVESFVAPVKGHDDLFTFFIPMEAKALDGGESVVVEENGDLTIEGYAAVWEGDDREGENFAPGAFTRAAKAFLGSTASLCFHHKHDHVLGKVLDLREDGKGLQMKARVDGAIKSHPVLGTYYEQIKAGTLSGLSVGGFFKRARGATVLFTTHVMAHAERLCDRLAIIAGGKRRFEGTVDDARAKLPMRAIYVPRRDDDDVAALLPAGAEHRGDRWRFTLPDEGIEPLIEMLMARGHGIAGLSIERPGLHDAFVRIVGQANVGDVE